MTDEAKEIKIYVDVINGVSKQNSRVRLTPELEAFWDETAEWVEQTRAANPGVVFEVPSEWPEA